MLCSRNARTGIVYPNPCPLSRADSHLLHFEPSSWNGLFLEPGLHFQSWYSFEMLTIVCDNDGPETFSMGCNHHVHWTNWYALGFECSSNLTYSARQLLHPNSEGSRDEGKHSKQPRFAAGLLDRFTPYRSSAKVTTEMHWSSSGTAFILALASGGLFRMM